MSIVQQTNGDFDEAIMSCTRALSLNSEAPKALYQRGKAFKSKNMLSEAKRDLVAAMLLDPKNK